MKMTNMTRTEKRGYGGADAPAVPTAIVGDSDQGWEGTREQGGNNWGNRFDLVFSSVFRCLLVFVPLFPLNSSLFRKRRLFSKTYKKTKSPFHISTSSPQEQGTREQTAFDPGNYGLFVFPHPREQPTPCSPASPERRSPCPVQ